MAENSGGVQAHTVIVDVVLPAAALEVLDVNSQQLHQLCGDALACSAQTYSQQTLVYTLQYSYLCRHVLE